MRSSLLRRKKQYRLETRSTNNYWTKWLNKRKKLSVFLEWFCRSRAMLRKFNLRWRTTRLQKRLRTCWLGEAPPEKKRTCGEAKRFRRVPMQSKSRSCKSTKRLLKFGM